MLVANTWTTDKMKFNSREEFDTLEDCKECAKLFEELCNEIPKPICISKRKRWEDKKYSFENGALFRGYIILDFTECELVKAWGDGLFQHNVNYKGRDKLAFKDKWFRGEYEVPKDYVWDEGEYEGWLQYRWGDGKNAIDRDNTDDKVIAQPKPKTKQTKKQIKTKLSELSEEERIQEEYDAMLDKELIKKLENRW